VSDPLLEGIFSIAFILISGSEQRKVQKISFRVAFPIMGNEANAEDVAQKCDTRQTSPSRQLEFAHCKIQNEPDTDQLSKTIGVHPERVRTAG
jgi:hypothetical protein